MMRAQQFPDGELARDLVDAYPDALLVQDRDRRLIAHNQAAERLLDGHVALRVGEDVACQLLGCRRVGGPLEGVCLHEHALEHEGARPALRIELPLGAAADGLRARVFAIGGPTRATVTELRPDRTEAGEAGWVGSGFPEPRLWVCVLGRTRVASDEGPLEGRWLEHRAGQLLKLLVAERHRTVFADELLARLWSPRASPDRRGLRYFIHVLREQLEPDGARVPPSSFVVAARGGYRLDGNRVWVDADAFEQLVNAGLAAHARGDEEAARDLVGRGLDLYRGEFLADEPYAEWALAERDRLHMIASDGLRAMVDLHHAADDFAGATGCLSRLADLEPFDVDIHRDLLTVLLRRGRRSEALRRYERLRRRMLDAFEEELDFSLAELV